MARLKKCMVKGCNKPATEKMLVVEYDSNKVKINYRYLCEKHYDEELKAL